MYVAVDAQLMKWTIIVYYCHSMWISSSWHMMSLSGGLIFGSGCHMATNAAEAANGEGNGRLALDKIVKRDTKAIQHDLHRFS